MIALALICASFAAPALEVTIAPDQPVPYVYADEPVILQIKSGIDGAVRGNITITSDDGKSISMPMPETALRADGAHWQPLETAPPTRGRYTVHVALDVADAKFETDLVYCRIDRPRDDLAAPFRVRIDNADAATLHALRGIPVRTVTLSSAMPEIRATVDAVIAAGFHVVISVDAAPGDDSAAFGTLVTDLGEKVAAWEIPVAAADAPSVEAAATAIRQSGSRAPLELAIAKGVDVPALMSNGVVRTANALLVPTDAGQPSARAVFARAAENAGYEAYPQAVRVASANAESLVPLVQTLIDNQYAGAAACEIDAASAFADGKFTAAYPMLSAMTHQLAGFEYAGVFAMPAPAQGRLFRKRDEWIVVAWSTGDASDQFIPVGAATDLALTDSNNNPLALKPLEDEKASLTLTASPLYFRGKGGPLFGAVARQSVRTEADAFVKNKAFQKELPPEVIEMIKPIAALGDGRVDRVTFFALLRLFPVLEQKWHDGTMRRDVAAPAMASLSRLIRNLCIIEQESGEPFIELFQETLARCSEYQSQYLTSTGGAGENHDRADWLLAEVSRLTAEAKDLAEAGNAIEAVGVASIAEWRARSLEFARNAAPLGTVEPPRVERKPDPKRPIPSTKSKQPAKSGQKSKAKK